MKNLHALLDDYGSCVDAAAGRSDLSLHQKLNRETGPPGAESRLDSDAHQVPHALGVGSHWRVDRALEEDSVQSGGEAVSCRWLAEC